MNEQSMRQVILDALFFCFYWVRTKEGPQYWYDAREAAIDEFDNANTQSKNSGNN